MEEMLDSFVALYRSHGELSGSSQTCFGPFSHSDEQSAFLSRLLRMEGDGARVDEDGYIWITGRVDDVINVR